MNDRRLRYLVEEYIQVHRPRRRALRREIAATPGLTEAIRQVGLLPDGSVHPHQRRIGRRTLAKFGRTLLRHTRRIRRADSFADLHDLLWELRIPGIGVLAVYDIAIQLGAYLSLEPTRVYLHAGTKVGAARLGLPTGARTLARRDLPEPLRRLKADELEDFLCMYKGAFAGGRRSTRKPCVGRPRGKRRSSC